ncbi:F-box only protein 15-like isoform X2 [Halichoeres trimaculatus]|uniref:F-box only protein 15-like isoform X2 n=1 Tax=Halichoeres trimaculatus TaxID=147232 RepID=UPI003D9F39E8
MASREVEFLQPRRPPSDLLRRLQLQERPPPEASVNRENFIERLPPELLMKILSYLDASSLLNVIFVSKRFHQIASENDVWRKLYTSEFGSQTWKPKLAHCAAKDVDFEEPRDLPAGHWRRMYLNTVTGREMYKFRKHLRILSPLTGLPMLTEMVLRTLNLNWELTVSEKNGREHVLMQSQLFFQKSSMIVCWSGVGLLKYYHIRTLQVHAVRVQAQTGLKEKKLGWHSLIFKVDLEAQSYGLIGSDNLIKVMHVAPGLMVVIWRADNTVVFIAVCLHFHKLVERSLLGFPSSPYTELDHGLVDTSVPERGLHGYTLNFTLHQTSTEIMSGCFHPLCCHRGRIRYGSGMIKLKAIDKADQSQHRPLPGNIGLCWSGGGLECSVEISGCIILGVFIYLKVNKDGNAITNESIPGIDLMIAIGVIVMVLGFLGCCGAIRENRCMLLLFFISLLIIFILLLAAGILGAVGTDKVKDWVKERLQKLTPLSDQPQSVRDDLEKLQRELQCCGLVNGPSDWDTVPSSCRCNATLATGCTPGAIHQTLCTTEIVELMEKNMEIVVGIAFAIAVLLIFGMAFSMVLYCQIGKKEGATSPSTNA